MRCLPLMRMRVLSACTILQPRAWPDGSGKIILTFDDGPNPKISARLLDVLRKNGVRATFCCIGGNAERAPEIVRQAWRDGHELANHTFRHSASDLFSRKNFRRELEATDRALAQTIGQPGFRTSRARPPFGLVPPIVAEAARQAGKRMAYLTFFIDDSGATARTAPRLYDRIKRQLLRHHGGAIVLHEMRFIRPDATNGPDKSWLPDAVDNLIDWARAHGLEFALYPDGEHDFK